MRDPSSGVFAAYGSDMLDDLSTFDPASLYEAAGRKGMLDPRIKPAWQHAKVSGPVVTVECPPGDNLMLHVAVAHAPAGAVLVVNAGGYLQAGAWGEVLTAAAQARGIVGLVIDGAVRDIDAIERAGFPVFSRGCAVGACTKERVGHYCLPIMIGGWPVQTGDFVLGDGDGVVVVHASEVAAVHTAARERRDRERDVIAQLKAGRTTIELLGLTDPLVPAREG